MARAPPWLSLLLYHIMSPDVIVESSSVLHFSVCLPVLRWWQYLVGTLASLRGVLLGTGPREDACNCCLVPQVYTSLLLCGITIFCFWFLCPSSFIVRSTQHNTVIVARQWLCMLQVCCMILGLCRRCVVLLSCTDAHVCMVWFQARGAGVLHGYRAMLEAHCVDVARWCRCVRYSCGSWCACGAGMLGIMQRHVM